MFFTAKGALRRRAGAGDDASRKLCMAASGARCSHLGCYKNIVDSADGFFEVAVLDADDDIKL